MTVALADMFFKTKKTFWEKRTHAILHIERNSERTPRKWMQQMKKQLESIDPIFFRLLREADRCGVQRSRQRQAGSVSHASKPPMIPEDIETKEQTNDLQYK